MNFIIQSGGQPIYEQLVHQAKQKILNGELKAGEALPSIRALAKDLEISVITTKRAYEELEQEGVICSVPGKGFYVNQPDTERLLKQETQGWEERLKSVMAEAVRLQISREEILAAVEKYYGEGKFR